MRFDSDEDQDLIQWIKSLRNKYSVDASAVGRPVGIRAYAERVEIRQEGRVVAEHAVASGLEPVAPHWRPSAAAARSTTPGITSRCWRASPAPCAVSHGVAIGSRPMANAPFKDWALPAPIERVRRKLRAAPDGDRQTVEILSAALADGLPAVEAACAEALENGVHSADPQPSDLNRWRPMASMLNILARPPPSPRPRRCGWRANPSPTAPDTTA